MEILRVQVMSGNQKTSGFLQDSPGRYSLGAALFCALMNIETQARSETDGTDDRMIRTAVYMRHDALPREILINEHMVGSLVRTVLEDVLTARCCDGNGQEALNGWIDEPIWQG